MIPESLRRAPQTTAVLDEAKEVVSDALDTLTDSISDGDSVTETAQETLTAVKDSALSRLKGWLVNEPVVVGEFTKIIAAAGIEFGAPIPGQYAAIGAVAVYTGLTFLVRRFTSPAKKVEQALYTPPPA